MNEKERTRHEERKWLIGLIGSDEREVERNDESEEVEEDEEEEEKSEEKDCETADWTTIVKALQSRLNIVLPVEISENEYNGMLERSEACVFLKTGQKEENFKENGENAKKQNKWRNLSILLPAVRWIPASITDHLVIRGKRQEMTFQIEKQVTGTSLTIDANAFLYGITNNSVFTIRIAFDLSAAVPARSLLEYFYNNLLFFPSLFEDVSLDARDIAGTGRQLFCRLVRDLLRFGVPPATIIDVEAKPSSFNAALMKNEQERLVKMYETLSFRQSDKETEQARAENVDDDNEEQDKDNDKDNEEQDKEKGNETERARKGVMMHSTLAKIVAACESDGKSARGTMFNR